MAVKAAGRGQRRALLQRVLETAGDLSDVIAAKISAAADPRARQLRRQRRALRWGLIFAAGCAFWAVVTAILAAWGWFALLLEVTGGVAVVMAIPATLLLIRYRWLKSEPLPAQRRPVSGRRLPPVGSAARPAMYALGASERGFFSLLGVIERGAMLPAGEVRELDEAAKRTSAAMRATATEVVSMERAANESESSRAYLVPSINAFTAQLSAGVRQYNEMVTAAAQLVSSVNGDPANSAALAASHRYRAELSEATDRLVGWAQAFDELGGVPRR
jgi:hypothetical protein